MSSTKLLTVVVCVIFIMTATAYATLDVPFSQQGADAKSEYTSLYLFGFITPLLTSGAILLGSCSIILRKKRKPRKISPQIQAV